MVQPSTGRQEEERKVLTRNRKVKTVGRRKTGGEFSTTDTYKMERMLEDEDMRRSFVMYPF
jgi:hypothetical protein